jgi:hypothetical protein
MAKLCDKKTILQSNRVPTGKTERERDEGKNNGDLGELTGQENE